MVTDTNPWAVNATSLSATNSFMVTVSPASLPGQPQTNMVAAGTLNWIAVSVPTNAIIATNTLLFATNLPVNLWFSTRRAALHHQSGRLRNCSPTRPAVRASCSPIGAPAFVPGGIYFLGVQNTNALDVTLCLARDVWHVGNDPGTHEWGSLRSNGIIHTNIGGTNGYLLTWFAPSNELFTVQWATNLSGGKLDFLHQCGQLQQQFPGQRHQRPVQFL